MLSETPICPSQDGTVSLDATRNLHIQTVDEFNVPKKTCKGVMHLLDKCEKMLTGDSLIQELSPKLLDQLVSYEE